MSYLKVGVSRFQHFEPFVNLSAIQNVMYILLELGREICQSVRVEMGVQHIGHRTQARRDAHRTQVGAATKVVEEEKIFYVGREISGK